MKAVLQRVKSARVTSEGMLLGEVGCGIAALVAVCTGDGEEQVSKMAEKIVNLRIFEDDGGRMNKSLLDTGGGVLCISNFTVAGDCSHGRRPSYIGAEKADGARPLFDLLLKKLGEYGVKVQTGRFGADMTVEITNDGPVTLILEV